MIFCKRLLARSLLLVPSLVDIRMDLSECGIMLDQSGRDELSLVARRRSDIRAQMGQNLSECKTIVLARCLLVSHLDVAGLAALTDLQWTGQAWLICRASSCTGSRSFSAPLGFFACTVAASAPISPNMRLSAWVPQPASFQHRITTGWQGAKPNVIRVRKRRRNCHRNRRRSDFSFGRICARTPNDCATVFGPMN